MRHRGALLRLEIALAVVYCPHLAPEVLRAEGTAAPGISGGVAARGRITARDAATAAVQVGFEIPRSACDLSWEPARTANCHAAVLCGGLLQSLRQERLLEVETKGLPGLKDPRLHAVADVVPSRKNRGSRRAASSLYLRSRARRRHAATCTVRHRAEGEKIPWDHRSHSRRG